MYKTSGLNQLSQALAQLGKQAGHNALSGALRDAAKPIVRDARANAPRLTGDLAKSIRTEVFRGKGRVSTDSVSTLHIGYYKKTGWYGQILERGAKPHRIPNKKVGRGRHKRDNKAVVAFGGKVFKSVNHPGTRPRPLLAPAFERGHHQALQIFKQRLYERIILQAIKKYGKRP